MTSVISTSPEKAVARMSIRSHRSSRPVSTPGAVTLATAYVDAARTVAQELFASWR